MNRQYKHGCVHIHTVECNPISFGGQARIVFAGRMNVLQCLTLLPAGALVSDYALRPDELLADLDAMPNEVAIQITRGTKFALGCSTVAKSPLPLTLATGIDIKAAWPVMQMFEWLMAVPSADNIASLWACFDELCKEVYANTLSDSLRIEVPESFATEHIDLLNAYEAILIDIEAMQVAFSDPIFALARIKNYENDSRTLFARASWPAFAAATCSGLVRSCGAT